MYLLIDKLVVETLKLTQFRNYESETIIFHQQINALTGMNGMGKTNVLDALYYLCLGKSYFSGTDKTIMMQEKDFFRIEGSFWSDQEKEKVVIKSKANSRKEIEISGKKVDKISDHVGRFLCVIIAPDDIQMMLEGSEERRNFINNTIVQTDKSYLEDLLLYNGLLKRRNALLKTFAEQKSYDSLLLESVTSGLYAPAGRIFERRQWHIEQMQPIFSEIYGEISGQKEQCNIIYQSQLAKDSLQNLIMRNEDRDKILARTTQGIHKDDLLFTMNGEPLRNFASQGQLKTFVLALKLTQYRLIQTNSGQQPILLLDDIFDKLDETRVHQLLEMLIKNAYGQIFITDTHQDRITKILQEINTEFGLYTIQDGKVVSINKNVNT